MEYNREFFPHWEKNKNGLDAREQLILDSIVSTNFILCPYTGKMFSTFSEMDADHVVSLKWAWVHGASNWNTYERTKFANDPMNLIMTADFTNRSKGSKGPFKWLPPNATFIEEYLWKYLAVCTIYGLSGFGMKDAKTLVRATAPFVKGVKIGRIKKWYYTWFGGVK